MSLVHGIFTAVSEMDAVLEKYNLCEAPHRNCQENAPYRCTSVTNIGIANASRDVESTQRPGDANLLDAENVHIE